MLRQLLGKSLHFHSAIRSLCSTAPSATLSVDKEELMKLRKRTGYSYVNCRKALVKFGSGNLQEAEKWLRECAKKEGWAKAAKLSSRATTQGLMAVKSYGPNAVIVEISCETDFVARGDNFKELLEMVTVSALAYAQINATKNSSGKIVMVDLDLNSLRDAEGKPLSEAVAMTISKLGENITVRSIKALFAPPDSSLYSAAHPRDGSPAVNMGRFVSVVALRRAKHPELFPTEKLAAQICQHVIGMRSETLGDPPQTQNMEKETIHAERSEDELNDFAVVRTTQIDEDETALLRQAFMLNPSQTVYDYLRAHQAEVVDFVRSELGAAE